MSQYDKQYEQEIALFGTPYASFETFVKEHAIDDGLALDLGCGQGRDALMLARHGYDVTGVDASQVGIEQMVERAAVLGLRVDGVVADFHEFALDGMYDAIVLDSILHFQKADFEREIALLDRLVARLNRAGFLFIFVHKSPAKERVLHEWLQENMQAVALVQDGYIDYVYEEKSTGFKSPFQMFMFIVEKKVSK